MWENIIIVLKFPSNCWDILGITRKIHRIVRPQPGFGSGTCECKYTHRSLFAGLYFVVLQMHRVSPRIKIRHLDPSVDESIRIVQQFENRSFSHTT